MPGMSFENGLLLWALLNDILSTLAWPTVALAFLVLFRTPLAQLLSSVEQAELPWVGGTVRFRREAAQLSADANRPDPEREQKSRPLPPGGTPESYNALQIERGLSPTTSNLDLNYFRNLVLSDPNLALAALRMEVETIIANIALGSKFELRHEDGAGRNLRAILEKNLITRQQFETARRVLDLCNRAIHGVRVDSTTALAVIEAVEPLLDDYKSWLYWNWQEPQPSAFSHDGIRN